MMTPPQHSTTSARPRSSRTHDTAFAAVERQRRRTRTATSSIPAHSISTSLLHPLIGRRMNNSENRTIITSLGAVRGTHLFNERRLIAHHLVSPSLDAIIIAILTSLTAFQGVLELFSLAVLQRELVHYRSIQRRLDQTHGLQRVSDGPVDDFIRTFSYHRSSVTFAQNVARMWRTHDSLKASVNLADLHLAV